MIKMSIKFGSSIYKRPRWSRPHGLLSILLLASVAVTGLLAGARAQPQGSTQKISRADQLPWGVRRMHQALTRAVRSGNIEHMREVLEMNELMPLVNGQFISDPVGHWKAQSRDNTGHEFLALLSELLELPPVKIKTNRQELYIWPYFAHMPLHKLTDSEIVRLYRLAPAAKTALMLKKNLYSHARIAIGADGTWHSYDGPDISSFEKPPQKP